MFSGSEECCLHTMLSQFRVKKFYSFWITAFVGRLLDLCVWLMVVVFFNVYLLVYCLGHVAHSLLVEETLE